MFCTKPHNANCYTFIIRSFRIWTEWEARIKTRYAKLTVYSQFRDNIAEMKFTLLFVLIFAVLLGVYAAPGKNATKPAPKKKQCLKDCGDTYKPVCAGDGSGKDNKSFGSECVLSNFNCENNKELKIVSEGECPGGGGIRLS